MPRRNEHSRAALSILGLLGGLVGCPDQGAEPGPGGDDLAATSAADTGSDPSSPTTSGPAATSDPGDVTVATDPDPSGAIEPMPCPPGVEPSMELGLGDETFRAPDSGPAGLVHGHQGGYHIVVGLRAVGVDLADWGTGHVGATLDGTVVSDHDALIILSCDASGDFAEGLWINVIFDDGTDPQTLLGQVVTVTAEYTDVSGQVVTAQADFTVSETTIE